MSTPPPTSPAPTTNASPKSFIATWLLSWLLGGLGIDRFYLGKVGTGIAKLLTFGGFGVWWLIDLILVLAGTTRDAHGRPLAGSPGERKIAWIVTGALVVLSIVISAISAAGGASTANDDTPAPHAPAVETATAPDATVASTEPADSDESGDGIGATATHWADSEFGTFAAQSFSGDGDDLITLPAGASGGIVTAKHSGDGHFAVAGLDAANTSTGELLVNTVGAYSGTTAYGINALGETVTLKVNASGPWTIELAPLSTAQPFSGESQGTGDTVLRYDGDSARLTATHDGTGNFVIVEENGNPFAMGLLVNEIGAYSGTVPLSSGPSIITVTADGAWTLAVN